MDNDEIDILKRKLSLYCQYVQILEHLCVFDGAIPLDDMKYNKSWLIRGNRSWLQEVRETIFNKINQLA